MATPSVRASHFTNTATRSVHCPQINIIVPVQATKQILSYTIVDQDDAPYGSADFIPSDGGRIRYGIQIDKLKLFITINYTRNEPDEVLFSQQTTSNNRAVRGREHSTSVSQLSNPKAFNSLQCDRINTPPEEMEKIFYLLARPIKAADIHLARTEMQPLSPEDHAVRKQMVIDSYNQNIARPLQSKLEKMGDENVRNLMEAYFGAPRTSSTGNRNSKSSNRFVQLFDPVNPYLYIHLEEFLTPRSPRSHSKSKKGGAKKGRGRGKTRRVRRRKSIRKRRH